MSFYHIIQLDIVIICVKSLSILFNSDDDVIDDTSLVLRLTDRSGV